MPVGDDVTDTTPAEETVEETTEGTAIPEEIETNDETPAAE